MSWKHAGLIQHLTQYISLTYPRYHILHMNYKFFDYLFIVYSSYYL